MGGPPEPSGQAGSIEVGRLDDEAGEMPVRREEMPIPGLCVRRRSHPTSCGKNESSSRVCDTQSNKNVSVSWGLQAIIAVFLDTFQQ